ncbi:bifunctional UDP-N-acetylglucosamine diphosphorylase/glucosamine-1-phosphate N-acetyltransferase GlmU [soil metagenome]
MDRARPALATAAAFRRQDAPWGKWQPEGFWFPRFWFESRRGSGGSSAGLRAVEVGSGSIGKDGRVTPREAAVRAVVLAAGHGRRMRSKLPKVLHAAGGRPLLVHVLAALAPLELDGGCIVVTPGRPEIQDALESAGLDDAVACVVQEPARGTADAVRVALESTPQRAGTLLVTAGDTPLLQTSTLQAVLDAHLSRKAAATILTAHVAEPAGYGRIVRDDAGNVEGVVEERDASDEQRSITEINAGTYVFDEARLLAVLAEVDADNEQGEYYLTDVVGLLCAQGDVVAAHRTDAEEVAGVNSRAELAAAGELLRARTCERWMTEGVTIVDPSTTYIDASVVLEPDVVLHPSTFLEGCTTVRSGARLGPQARVVDSEVGREASISFSVVVGSIIGDEASVGPFASLRRGTRLERGAKIGSFVETKQTTLGKGSKANHLAYLGDAEIGEGVNIGAGTITCNWDGRAKHKTVIEDEAYVASDTMLVAPVRIGRRAATGAGAVVRDDVPDEALAVGVPARVIEGKGNRTGDKRAEGADATEG